MHGEVVSARRCTDEEAVPIVGKPVLTFPVFLGVPSPVRRTAVHHSYYVRGHVHSRFTGAEGGRVGRVFKDQDGNRGGIEVEAGSRLS